LETVIMNSRLAVTVASIRKAATIFAVVLASFAALGLAKLDDASAEQIVGRLVPSLATDAKFGDKLPPIAFGTVDIVTGTRSAMVAPAADVMAAWHEPGLIFSTAPTASLEVLRPETSPQPAAKIRLATREASDINPAVGSTQVVDDCLAADTCVDQYLWAIYQRTPKEDSVKTQERRKVTVRKKGRLVTVTMTFTTVANEDFSWKDPKAAEKARLPLLDYVIGGMDRDFKLRLFNMLRVAEEAGLSPGITSAFRDDFRQSIATGLKAANDRSYHGGSFHGGYGHGLAADLVSVNGATRAQRMVSSETLWNWIDAHGKEFGVGRPYLDRDPPHVGPIDGKEYATHHPGTNTRQAVSAKSRHTIALRGDAGAAKHAITSKSSKLRTMIRVASG
jgi:hypothetical protein